MQTESINTLGIPFIFRSLPGMHIYLLPDAPHFTILDANDAFIAASQFQREDLIGKRFFEVFPGVNDPSVKTMANLKASFLQVIQSKKPDDLPVQQFDIDINENGKLEEHFWLPKCIPLLDEDGEVALIMHSVEDVTASVLLEKRQKQTNALLEKNQQHYFSLFEQNPDAVFSFDLEGNFISANHALSGLLECSQEEIYQTTFIPFVAPQDLEKTLYHFGEAGKGIPQRYNVGLVTAKGNNRILNVTNLPIVVENQVVGVYGIAKDITDFITTQQELLNSIKRFQSVSKVSNDAIWEWNLITNEINRSGNEFYHQFRFTQTESPITDFWINLIHPDDVERVLNTFKEAIDNPEIQVVEETYQVLKADGSYAYILDRGLIVRDELGVAIHIYGAAKDITQRKKLEAEREFLIKELTQSNSDLKQFAYVTSHNIRTPIANLISLGKLIDDSKVADPLTRLLLEKYKQTTHKLNETVNDLLEILVIKNNQEIPRKEIALDQVFNQVVESVENIITESNAVITTDFSAGNFVNFNPGYLHSILLNLLTNAVKYRSTERRLQINVFTEIFKDSLHLHFSDNGLGLDLEKYGNRIFGLYQKFHDHPESKGLGLHIIASQVKAMGGEISIKSTVNSGTTFTIEFKN